MSGAVGRLGSDDEVFARWYRDHRARIFAQCRRFLRDDAAAEDIAHEALLRAWLGRERIREEDLGAWLAVVARNLCVSHARKQRRVVPTETLPDIVDETADPALTVERLESHRAVRRALRHLGERPRRLLFLREVNGLEYEALGADMGLSPEGARSIAFRARRALRAQLAALGEGLGAWVIGVRVRMGQAWRRVERVLPVDSIAVAGVNVAVVVAMAIAQLSGTGGVLNDGRLPVFAAPLGVFTRPLPPYRGTVSIPTATSGRIVTEQPDPPKRELPVGVKAGAGVGDKIGNAKARGEIETPIGTFSPHVTLWREPDWGKSYTYIIVDAAEAAACNAAARLCAEVKAKLPRG